MLKRVDALVSRKLRETDSPHDIRLPLVIKVCYLDRLCIINNCYLWTLYSVNDSCFRGFEASFWYKSTLWETYSHLGRVFFLQSIHCSTTPSGRYIILVCVIGQWISFLFSLGLRSNLPKHNPETYIIGGWSQRMTATLTSSVGCKHRSKRGSIIFMMNSKICSLKMIGWLIFLGCLSDPLLVYSWIFELQEQRALA